MVQLESHSTLRHCLRFFTLVHITHKMLLPNVCPCTTTVCQSSSSQTMSPYSPQKLGVVPVVVTSGERKGLGNDLKCTFVILNLDLDSQEFFPLLSLLYLFQFNSTKSGNPLVAPSPGQLIDHQNLLSDIHTQFQAWVSRSKKVKVTCFQIQRQIQRQRK